jgi:metal-dependent HD superfamily phosphatase/phosphodiesterase
MSEVYKNDAEQIKKENDNPIRLPTKENDKRAEIVEKANNDTELNTIWKMQNVTAAQRKGYSDHGPVHVQIVTNIALKIARLIFNDGVEPSLFEDYEGFDQDDVETVIALAALMHDVGMSVHREDHEEFSLVVAKDILDRFLDDFYTEEEKTIIRSEALHAIISHRSDNEPLTVEAGVVRVADALDMEKGRSRIMFESGEVDIHSVSAAAVDEVELQEGDDRPVQIRIHLNNSAGIFQVDELLHSKLKNSKIQDQLSVEAVVDGETEDQILHEFKL